ncbi:MAG TPA: DUF397 domain-containing protein [Pseudonocardiaceae bacterium]|nr:DUF397 domain-containing protein [Pseudonocardiaceae bacterium]
MTAIRAHPTAHRRSGWRKSTHSAQEDRCAEVNLTCDGMEIRHSKIAGSPVISFTTEQWSRWLDGVVTGNLTGTNGAVTVLARPGSWTVRDVATGTELVFDEQEWTAFRLGARDGEFDLRVIAAVPT